jgi:dTDP-4-amino-4,6-dideoxygalactose transaminase
VISALQKAGFGFSFSLMTPVPLLDLKRQYVPLREAIETRVREVLDSQHFILGPAVESFEEAVRAYCGAGFAVGMSSGTDAQLAVLMALQIGPGDAAITTPFTFFATAGCVSRVGARPVFVDIDAQTFNLSPAALAHYLKNVARRDSGGILRAPTGERLRAIIPVHLFGQCCAMEEILALAREFDLPVLEDASQALGAECRLSNGVVQAGTMGAMGWFSFFPSKNLGAFGDAGLTVGRDPAQAPLLRSMRMHGMEAQYFHRFVGGNFRLDALQAAVLGVKLPHLNDWSNARRANAAAYREAFTRAGLLEKIRLPHETHPDRAADPDRCVDRPHIYHQYVVRVPAGQAERDRLRAHLGARGVGSAIYYPLALHQQECFRPLGYSEGDFPQAEAAAREVVALPIFPELTREEQNAVVAAIADFYS